MSLNFSLLVNILCPFQSDIDESADLAERFAVAAMPTFFFVKSGEKVDQLIGANLAKLEITIIRLLEDAA